MCLLRNFHENTGEHEPHFDSYFSSGWLIYFVGCGLGEVCSVSTPSCTGASGRHINGVEDITIITFRIGDRVMFASLEILHDQIVWKKPNPSTNLGRSIDTQNSFIGSRRYILKTIILWNYSSKFGGCIYGSPCCPFSRKPRSNATRQPKKYSSLIEFLSWVL